MTARLDTAALRIWGKRRFPNGVTFVDLMAELQAAEADAQYAHLCRLREENAVLRTKLAEAERERDTAARQHERLQRIYLAQCERTTAAEAALAAWRTE